MRVAIIGSRYISCSPKVIEKKIIEQIPQECSEIVSGGAIGIDTYAEKIAKKMNIPLKCFLPNYNLYGKTAPLERNIEIINYSDYVLAFWNTKSRGTQFVMSECIKRRKPIKVIII